MEHLVEYSHFESRNYNINYALADANPPVFQQVHLLFHFLNLYLCPLFRYLFESHFN